jgi:predicted enzyme related to lactoylglutathione lyase
MKPNPVVHFEMPYENRDRMCDFYAKAFGWTTNKLGEDMGNYVVAMTTEMDLKNKFPKETGRINGGFYKKTADPLSQSPSFVIAVPDIQEAMKKRNVLE